MGFFCPPKVLEHSFKITSFCKPSQIFITRNVQLMRVEGICLLFGAMKGLFFLQSLIIPTYKILMMNEA